MKERELKIVSEEQRLDRERNTIEKSFNIVNEEKHKLEEFARQIQIKSKEVEELSKVLNILFFEEPLESLRTKTATPPRTTYDILQSSYRFRTLPLIGCFSGKTRTSLKMQLLFMF